MDTGDVFKECGLKSRRQSTTHLNPLHIPPLDTSEPVRYVESSLRKQKGILPDLKDVEDECQDLFCNFLKNQIQKDPQVVCFESLVSDLSGYKTEVWQRDGSDLYFKADAFSMTKERNKVKIQSASVNLEMSEDQYYKFLSQCVSQKLMNLDRILMVFFLCSDVVIKALKESHELFQKYLLWSLSFIKQTVSWWIQQQGGWQTVLKTPVQPVFKVCLWAAISAIALFIVVRLNKFKDSWR